MGRPPLPCRPSSESRGVPPKPRRQTFSPAEEPVGPRSVHLRPKSASRSRQEARASGCRYGRYFGCSSSSLAEEAKPLRIVDISPVAAVPYGATQETQQRRLDVDTFPPPPLPDRPGSPSPTMLGRSPNSRADNSAPSGILQYLSLPFFKEMNVDGDWPPEESETEAAALGRPVPRGPALADGSQLAPVEEEERTASAVYMGVQSESDSIPDRVPASFLLGLPEDNEDLAEAPLPDAPASPLTLGSDSERALPSGRGSWLWTPSPSQAVAGGHSAELPCGAAPSEDPCPPLPEGPRLPAAAGFAQGLPRGSLTSESSGRGSGSFLKPPSSAPSPAGSYLSSPFGDVSSCRSSAAGDGSRPRQDPVAAALGKRRNPSVDENYEWDSEFALEADLLDALQLYRSGEPRRPVSTIAAHELAKQNSTESSSTSPSNAQSVSALDGSSSPPSLASPEARCAALREEFLAYRRRREMIQRRRQKMEPGGEADRCEEATLF